jgi:hypothetical protein
MRAWALLLLHFALPARADLEPGSWEISASTHLKGGEPVQMTQTHCLSAAQAADPSRLFGSAGAGCQFTKRSDTGSLFTFEVLCGSQPRMRGSGSVRYGRDSLNGELELTSEQFTARSRIAGRRLGGC